MSSHPSAGFPPIAPPPEPADAWEATRVHTAMATQLMRDESDYLAPEKHDVGRQTGTNERELFVSCDPALAMRQQFEHLRPDYIAVHDIATASSRKLLAGIAAASSRAVQKLLIRRQGYGTTLASLEFVELPTSDGGVLRMYSTEADADTAARVGLAKILLGFSRLGVIMVGDLPGHSIASALKPIQESIVQGPWPNRQLLLLPLAAGSTLMAHGMEMARGTHVVVRTAPQVTRPADAWGYINGTWGRLGDPADGVPARRVTAPEPTEAARSSAAARAAPPDPLALRPMPAVSAAPNRGATPRGVLETYVHQLCELPGMVSCCVFDVASGLEVAHAGASPRPEELAMQGKMLLAAMGASSRGMGMGHTLPEAAITLGSHHLLLRAVPGHPRLALHAALDKASANLTLVRLQVQRLDAVLTGAAPPGQ